MVFLNTSETLGLVIASGTQSLTGDIFLTLLLILIFLIVVCLMFSIPLEFTAIIILPICISAGAYYSSFVAPLGIILIYLATLLTKNWLFK